MKEGTKNIMRLCGFVKEVEKVESGICPICDNIVTNDEFRDEISRKEYDISGMCQQCQDAVFNN